LSRIVFVCHNQQKQTDRVWNNNSANNILATRCHEMLEENLHGHDNVEAAESQSLVLAFVYAKQRIFFSNAPLTIVFA